MPVNTDLGELLLRLNPYSNNRDPQKGAFTGPVDIYLSGPPSWPVAGAVAGGPPGGQPAGAITQVELQMESDYPAEWSFKGQPQKVYKTVRIKYRYPVLDQALPAAQVGAAQPNVLYWVEDYLLIGYEGSGAG